ncbi:hypothetical protein RF11_03883 [Thelohanellus kitauei]|uniref:Uncharacterized protein n=1 Tax=Thelohanellus kitauei TaxID=669202 RepID=A0A0C2MJE7_THEKT|nr:hypothetical protein RF11_03883 [Thelohanellus kitauei]
MQALDRFMARGNHKNPVWAEITQKLIQTLRMPRWWLLRVVDSGEEWVIGMGISWEAGLVLLARRQGATPDYNARLADIRCTCANSNAKSEMDYYINREAMPKGKLAIDRRGGRAVRGLRVFFSQCDSDTPYRRDACIDPLGRLCANLGNELELGRYHKWGKIANVLKSRDKVRKEKKRERRSPEENRRKRSRKSSDRKYKPRDRTQDEKIRKASKKSHESNPETPSVVDNEEMMRKMMGFATFETTKVSCS